MVYKKSTPDAKLYLVLGGNGFVGSHIIDQLTEHGNSVRVLDPFNHEPRFKHPKSIDCIKGSAFNSAELDDALKDVTHVIYSLSATNPFSADSDPYADIDNLKKGIEILEACVRHNVNKIGFLSSGGAVYGHVAEYKSVTEDDVALPISPYGICKLAMEHYMEYFRKKHGLNYVVLRLSNPYGPRQVLKNGQGVIAAFIKQISADERITIFGDGKASRDYIYIEDASRLIVNAMESDSTHRVYNIGSGVQTDLMSIIERLEILLNKQANVKFAEAPQTTLKKTNLDVSRSHAELAGFELLNIHDGLKRTVDHYIHSASAMLSSTVPLLNVTNHTEPETR